MPKTLAHILNRILWTVIITVLLLLAAYVSIGRYYIERLEQHQQPLLDSFKRYTGLSIKADNLRGEWSKLSPVFFIQKLAVEAADGSGATAISADQLVIEVDPLASLLNGSLQLKKLQLADANLHLDQQADGRWQVRGFPSNQRQQVNTGKIIDLLLSIDQAAVAHSQIRLSPHAEADSVLSLQELSLQHRHGFRRLRLQAGFAHRAADIARHPLAIIAEAKGDPRELTEFSSQAYLKLEDINFQALLPLLKSTGIDLQAAKLNGELWLDWQPQTEISMQGLIETPLLDFAAISGKAFPALQQAAIAFRAEKNAGNLWQGWISKLQGQWQQQTFSFEKIFISSSNDQLDLATAALDLATLAKKVTAIDALDPKIKELVATLNPSGQLKNLHLLLPLSTQKEREDYARRSRDQKTVEPQGSQALEFTLKANLESVGVDAWRNAPGAKQLSGYLNLKPHTGEVIFSGNAIELSFPKVYRQPLGFDSINGQVWWRIENQRLLLNSTPLQLSADHGPANVLLSLDVPIVKGAELPPMMTLAVGLLDTDISYRNKFIPATISPNLQQWLDESLLAGQINRGGFLYRGSLRRGDVANRTVQLFFDVEDTELDYRKPWPQLQGIAGLVMVDNTEVEVVANQAQLFNLDFSQLSANVVKKSKYAGSDAQGSWLTVNAVAGGSSHDALRIVNESPIRDQVKDSLASWQMEGAATIGLALELPLFKVEQAEKKTTTDKKTRTEIASSTDIQVAVDFNDAKLFIPEVELGIEQLAGRINYSSGNGLSSTDLAAQLFNQPFSIDIQQPQANHLSIDIASSIKAESLQQWLQQPILSFLSGGSEFSVTMDIGDSRSNQLSLSSSLQGMAINLPGEFSKPAESALDFSLRVPLSKNPQMKMQLADWAALSLQLREQKTDSALLVLKPDVADLGEEISLQSGKFSIAGIVNQIVLDDWLPVIDQYQQAVAPAPKKQAVADEPAQQKNKPNARLQPQVNQLVVGQIKAFDQQWNNSVFRASYDAEAWWVMVDNADISGALTFFDDDNKPARARLSKLRLPKALLNSSRSNKKLRQADLPDFAMNVEVGSLFMGDDFYGRLSALLENNDQGFSASSLRGNVRGLLFTEERPTALTWKTTESGELSRFVGQINVANLKEVLANWNYEQFIESEYGYASMDVRWSGSPSQWRPSKMRGPVSLYVNKGQFLKASDTTTGTLKVVGIINLTNLVRRLSLDFSDLYDSGISYDRIGGDLMFDNGRLSIIDELAVKTPSSKFALRGDADLLESTLDMELIATLPVASNLPWLAMLTGNIPAAAGVFVASKIFEKQVDKLSSAVYDIDGNWNEPSLKLKQVFDDGDKGPSEQSTAQAAELDDAVKQP